MRKFNDYLVHINSLTHKNNITKNPLLNNRAKNTFERINKFWNEKEKEKNNQENNIETEKNNKLDHNKINSISSFSSAASTFKNDESISLIKSMNSFLLEQEFTDENNKENFNENNMRKIKNKY